MSELRSADYLSRPSDKYRNEWRRVRLQLIYHILESTTWNDICLGGNALFRTKLLADGMIREADENWSDPNVGERRGDE
jgi:hypothetical protein